MIIKQLLTANNSHADWPAAYLNLYKYKDIHTQIKQQI